MARNVIFKQGTRATYDAIAVKDSNTLYWLSDTQELYKGDVLFGKGANATQQAAGLLSAEDKAYIDRLVATGILGFQPVDGSLEIVKVGDNLTIGVAVSDDADNILEVKADGLFVPRPEDVEVPVYTMEDTGLTADGAARVYKLKKTLGGISEYVGDPVLVDKETMLNGGELKYVETAGVPYAGAEVGDPYLDLVLNDPEETHIYVPVKGLVDTYTAGDGIQVANHVISVVNRTVEVLQGPNGTARIWNESDGGGVQFTHTDGTRSFTGVNDGGKGGITGQLYSVDTKNGNLGTRINMTTDGFFYFKGKSSATAYTAEDEIATKGDVKNALVWEAI